MLLKAQGCKTTVFQSTPSARRATTATWPTSCTSAYFNPRPPRGGRQESQRQEMQAQVFQSTPSARRATSSVLTAFCGNTDFNPRPPRGGRRCRRATPRQHRMISIHALREEGDVDFCIFPPLDLNFNPRPPRGGRLGGVLMADLSVLFQSTPSARRATRPMGQPACRVGISIHALREEGDHLHNWDPADDENFNPRPPRGGRRGKVIECSPAFKFQSTPSARRATQHGDQSPRYSAYFNPRPPRGGRHAFRDAQSFKQKYFNPRPPRGGRPSA